MNTAAISLDSAATGDQINDQLLKTVGTPPDQATATELMQAVSQVARQQLSQRWVATQEAASQR